MQKSFKKSLIAASIGLAVGGASMGAIAADYATTNLLFPFVSTATNAYTFITIVQTGPAVGGGAATNVHFAYSTKPITAPNTGVGSQCDHADSDATMTPNDVMQFEVRKRIDLPNALGDATSAPFYYLAGVGRHGFLIANANTVGGLAGARLTGEAVIIDIASGQTMAYSTTNLNTNTSANPDFTINNTGVAGGPEAANTAADPDGAGGFNSTYPVSWYPAAIVTTGWFVAPLGTRLEMTPALPGGLVAAYAMYETTYAQTGAYNINEQFVSGGLVTEVTCLGVLTRADLLQGGALIHSNGGGYAHLAVFNDNVAAGLAPLGGTAATPHKSLVYKLQSTSALGVPVATVTREARLH